MDLRQLKYFLAVAEEGQITKAAKKLNITQPPLSQQMQFLEKELGLSLFERGKNHIRLTQAGSILKARAEQLFDLLHTTVTELQETTDGNGGRLAIGTITSAGNVFLPKLIQQYNQRYPKVTFHIRQGETEKILELLTLGLVEIGLVRFPVDYTIFDYIRMPQENMVLAATASRLPPGAQPIVLEQLCSQPLLVHQRHIAIITEHCRQAGFLPTILCSSDDIFPLLVLANLSIGIAVVPKSAIHLLPALSLHYREITTAITTTSAVVWSKKRPLSIAAKQFIELFSLKVGV
ncbi:MAG: catM 2 [Firmicutes bacterium]|nr:catM 2 [Bacillota bacterium]